MSQMLLLIVSYINIVLVIMCIWFLLCFFYGSFLLIMFRVSHAFVSVHCSLVVTCWERADLLALACDV